MGELHTSKRRVKKTVESIITTVQFHKGHDSHVKLCGNNRNYKTHNKYATTV